MKMKKIITSLIVFLITMSLVINATSPFSLITNVGETINYNYRKELTWDWKNIDTNIINGKPVIDIFKDRAQTLTVNNSKWLWGVGTSAHQVEGGCTNNNWYEWSQLPEQKAKGMVDAGIACDQWNRYKEDIKLLKKLGVNTYRLSVEWSKVEPQEGIFDQAVLDHYEDLCKTLLANDIQPVITLFHYTEPLWFYHKDGFEKEENIHYFVEFAQKVIDRLHPYVHLWLTFNSPSGHASQGWLVGTKPPAKKDLKLMVRVLRNLLEAHIQVYQAVKAQPYGKDIKVGILKNIFQVDPYNRASAKDQFFAFFGNYLVNTLMYNYLTTGSMNTLLHWTSGIKSNDYLKNGGKCLDFIGLNYYSHGYIKGKQICRHGVDEIPTANPQYTIYAEGLYRAIKELSDNVAKPLNIPIYITENGIAPIKDNDDTRRLFSQRYLYALAKAIEDGYDVRGYILWSFMDNYEWGNFEEKRYGLYHVNFDTQERTLKAGADYYINVIKQSVMA